MPRTNVFTDRIPKADDSASRMIHGLIELAGYDHLLAEHFLETGVTYQMALVRLTASQGIRQ